MGVNLSIKDVDPVIVEKLKSRAKQNHRSLQGELMAIIEEVVTKPPRKTITLDELMENGRRLGLKTPSESVQMIREDRDR
jgi:hypothetical protein